MRSSFGLTKGLAVDISAPLKYKAEMDFRENVRAQKEQEAAQKRLSDMQDKIRIESKDIGIPQYQQKAKDVTSKFFDETMQNYQANPKYLNSIDFARKFNETVANISNISAQDKTMSRDLQFQMEHQQDYGLVDNLGETLRTGTQQQFEDWLTKNGGYTAGKGLVQIHNQDKFMKSVLQDAPTIEEAKVVGRDGSFDIVKKSTKYDPDYLAKAIQSNFTNNPQTAHHFNNDPQKALASLPAYKSVDEQTYRIPTGGNSAPSYKTQAGKFRWVNLGSADAPVIKDNVSGFTYSLARGKDNMIIAANKADAAAKEQTNGRTWTIPTISIGKVPKMESKPTEGSGLMTESPVLENGKQVMVDAKVPILYNAKDGTLAVGADGKFKDNKKRDFNDVNSEKGTGLAFYGYGSMPLQDNKGGFQLNEDGSKKQYYVILVTDPKNTGSVYAIPANLFEKDGKNRNLAVANSEAGTNMSQVYDALVHNKFKNLGSIDPNLEQISK